MPFRRHAPFWILSAAAVLALPARAETNPWYVGGSETVSHDDNLLQLADGQATPLGYSKSDTTSTLSLLAGIDQPFGRQHYYGSVRLGDNRMAQNKVYNNQSYALSGGIDWSTVDRLSGTLTLAANRNLAAFNQVGLGLAAQRNIQNTRQAGFTANLGVVTRFSLQAAAGYNSVNYSATTYQVTDFSQDYESLGVHYQPSGVSDFGITLRNTNGRYPNFFEEFDGSFQGDHSRRHDIELSAHLQPSDATSLTARLSYGTIRYAVATQNDYDGLTGIASLDWQATGKLHVSAQITRDPGQDTYFLPSFVANTTVNYSQLTTALSARVDYQATGKLAAYASVYVNRRSLVDSFSGVYLPVSGSDDSAVLTLGGTWNATRNVQLGCAASGQQRHGQTPVSSNLHDANFNCYVQGLLGP